MYSLLSGVYLFPPVKAFIRPTSCLFLVDCFESTADNNISVENKRQDSDLFFYLTLVVHSCRITFKIVLFKSWSC